MDLVDLVDLVGAVGAVEWSTLATLTFPRATASTPIHMRPGCNAVVKGCMSM